MRRSVNSRSLSGRHARGVRFAAAALVALASGCNQNLLVDPDVTAASLPDEADVAVGAHHDLLIAACEDSLTLADLLAPVVFSAIFVSWGRLDAAFYLPGALVQSATPTCRDKAFTVVEAGMDGPQFNLEPTSNPAAFRAQATTEGSTTFTAVIRVGDEDVTVSTALRAWTVDRIEFAPACTSDPQDGTRLAASWVPAGGLVSFLPRRFHGSLPLTGYGLPPPVEHPRLVPYAETTYTVAGDPGEFTLSAAVDPAYSHTLRVYDLAAFDAVALSRVSDELLLVGRETLIRPHATVGGATPCVWGFPRQVTIETPAVCGFPNRPDVATLPNVDDHAMEIAGLTPGTCRVRVDLPGTPLAATLELDVAPSFDEVAVPEPLGPNSWLTGMWAAGPDDLFLVGWRAPNSVVEGMILRLDAGEWRATVGVSGGSLRDVHGLAPSGPAWAVGAKGTAVRYDGRIWQPVPTGVTATLYGVWMKAADDVWAVGEQGTVLHWNGLAWTTVPSGTDALLRDVWAPPGGDPIVVGGGTVLRLASSGPEPVLPGDLDVFGFDAPHAVAGASADDVWIVDVDVPLAFDGGTWSVPALGLDPTAGFGVADAWPVGDGFAYVLVNDVEGTPHVAQFDGARAGLIPLTSDPTREAADQIEGHGTTVWARSAWHLYRYSHDPAIRFP